MPDDYKAAFPYADETQAKVINGQQALAGSVENLWSELGKLRKCQVRSDDVVQEMKMKCGNLQAELVRAQKTTTSLDVSLRQLKTRLIEAERRASKLEAENVSLRQQQQQQQPVYTQQHGHQYLHNLPPQGHQQNESLKKEYDDGPL